MSTEKPLLGATFASVFAVAARARCGAMGGVVRQGSAYLTEADREAIATDPMDEHDGRTRRRLSRAGPQRKVLQ